MEKKTMIIGLVALVVIGGALYLHNKKKGKVSSADGDEDESNYIGAAKNPINKDTKFYWDWKHPLRIRYVF
jgi:hypothetical protein